MKRKKRFRLKRVLCFLLATGIACSSIHVPSVHASNISIEDITNSNETEPEIVQDADKELGQEEKNSDNTTEDVSSDENMVEETGSGLFQDTIVPAPDTQQHTGKSDGVYWNYFYGDPSNSGNYTVENLDGEKLPEIYIDDLASIIRMAEEGMDLSWFFRGTLFESFTLKELYQLLETGITLEDAAQKYLYDAKNLPEGILDCIQASAFGNGIMSIASAGRPGSMTAAGVKQLWGGALGVEQVLGGSKSHGPVVKLTTTGDGKTYDAFCASYGSSYRTGYQYVPAEYSELLTPEGKYLNSEQYEMIRFVISAYLKTTQQTDVDYAGAQVVIWYIINNSYGVDQFYYRGWAEGSGPLVGVAQKIAGGNQAAFDGIRGFILTVQVLYDAYQDGLITMEDFSAFTEDYYPGMGPELWFWKSSVNNAQWIFTWDITEGDLTGPGIGIPIVNNFYLEKEAIANYSIDLTKESVITNELLEGFQFLIVESEASGYDLDYIIKTGEIAGMGTADYAYPELPEGATTGTFGNYTEILDLVPYMDDDIEPSGGAHKTTLTTDENGHASTTFVHKHTFREYYSECLDGNLNPISYESYEALWAYAESVAKAQDAAVPGSTITIQYLGRSQQLTYAKIQAIHAAQTRVYTQTRDEARETLNRLYNAYKERTYTYTVTELESYTRQGGTDSNGKILETIPLPHDGYRKDVQDVTTIGPYVEVLADGETMIPGGGNDQDPNTKELNVTNEPWYNQIFIHKTDLETNNQILYDTYFEIYEYYQYKVNLTPAKIPVYPALILSSYRNADTGARINPKTIKSAKLHVYSTGGSEVYSEELNTQNLISAMEGTATDYLVYLAMTHSGGFRVVIEITIDTSLDPDGMGQRVIQNSTLEGPISCTCESICDPKTCPICKADPKFCKLNGTEYELYTPTGGEPRLEKIESYLSDGAGNGRFTTPYATYTFETDGSGVVTYMDEQTGRQYRSNEGAGIETNAGTDNSSYFRFVRLVDDVYFFTQDGGASYVITGPDGSYSHYEQKDGNIILYYTDCVPDGTWDDNEYWINVDESQITRREIDRNVNTDPNDYTTWGLSKNYEIVRVTAEIAKQMGWSDTTIGMYTVHRLSPIDQYAGTTFTNHFDESNQSYRYGYYEYGTLYFTQANQGLFAIVERTAPADGNKTGYLGNYEDRNYDYLDKEGKPSNDLVSSSTDQKNYDGAPLSTKDSMSTVKYVHYIDLCSDTNQYATYMLVDGHEGYTKEPYAEYTESVTADSGEQVPTLDGYDALYYVQSSLVETIGLKSFTLPGPFSNDVLNSYWDTWFSNALTKASGIQVLRNSAKTDTWFSLLSEPSILHHYVGTTINKDSFDDNDAYQSDIAYDGTYTGTRINYHTYAGEDAGFLNAREGFHDVDYLQVGTVTYDDAAQEKDARYHHTQADVSKEKGYAFIDEREYAYIRFSKYDNDAKRYVDGDLDEDYISGTDHADGDLDGAVYSLYVDESNSFTVEYLEGTLSGKLFWAQPLNGGGYTLIWDGDGNNGNGFTDLGNNETTDYPHAYVTGDKGSRTLHLDYGKTSEADGTDFVLVTEKSTTYRGIQHPDGRYGGEKHNGFFAVLTEQQVFIDRNEDGYSDTWTLQDVTLYNGAKVASAVIEDGELAIDGLYLGTYYLAEEIRDAITIHSTDNNDVERSENRWLSFAAGYLADTDEHGNPTHYVFRFPYTTMDLGGEGTFEAEQDYVHKDTNQVSYQQVIKSGAQFKKVTTNGESGSSNNTKEEALEGAGFTVFLISELSLVKDGTIPMAYSEYEGHRLVEANALTKLFDESGNMVGYEFTRSYMTEGGIYAYFDQKYPDGYNMEDVNRLLYVKDRGYYYIQDILDAYRNLYYDEHSAKWDFSKESDAIARIYEDDADYIQKVNAGYQYVSNHLNNGSPCEYYGVDGLSEGWVETGVKNEYRLSEIFSNHYGVFRLPEIAWGAYVVVETTTPVDVFTVEPYFITITDSSPSENKSRSVTFNDTSFVASLVLIKRDSQSGQDVLQNGISYRIWDYKNNKYVDKYLLGENGAFSMVSQRVFSTDENGRINAVASLEAGLYRLEEISGPDGFHNMYWDYGNWTAGETLGGKGADESVPNLDNMFQKYYGCVDFEITTERLFKASGITSSDNLDYIYVGEFYFNDEVQGKLTIQKTGEVLVGYMDTDDLEYADEFTASGEDGFRYGKSMARERSVFESMKDYYDLGRDEIKERELAFSIEVDSIVPVKYLAKDRNGMYLAAIREGDDGQLVTMYGGKVYQSGCYLSMEGNDNERTFYPGAVVAPLSDTFVYSIDGKTWYPVKAVTEAGGTRYKDLLGAEVTDKAILEKLKTAISITTVEGSSIYAPQDLVTIIHERDGYLMIVYDLSIDSYEGVTLEEAKDTYIYTVSGEAVNTAYLVTEKDGILTTNDYGVLTRGEGNIYTLSYTEAVYDPDINYNFTLQLSDGSKEQVKLVTDGVYLTTDGRIVRALKDGGYTIEQADGTYVTDEGASLLLEEENTGTTYDFVYEERRLAGATFVIRAAEDIYTQDGGEINTWFKEGDIVATVTTANDGEFVFFSPDYNRGGTFDATYYYGNLGNSYPSLTQELSYQADEFETSGSIENHWVAGRMSSLELSLYGIPSYTDPSIYPNTFYREGVQRIYRRITREGVSSNAISTQYQTRLEAENGLSSEGYGVLSETKDGFLMTYMEVVFYPDAVLLENGDTYLLTGTGRAGDEVDIEVKKSNNLYQVTECLNGEPFLAGDLVRKSASGYQIIHQMEAEPGIWQGASVDGAADLAYTVIRYYPNATIFDHGDGTFTLYDSSLNEVVRMQGGLYETEAGGLLFRAEKGFTVTYTHTQEYTANQYVTPSLVPKEATLVLKDEELHLTWDSAKQQYVTGFGTSILFTDDYSSVAVNTNGDINTYSAFDFLMEYDFHYAVRENIVSVEKDGNLGTVSVYLPLGRYEVREIATPYGFLIHEEPQEVNFSFVDQVKEIVFNDEPSSIKETDRHMNVWLNKALSWFVGGVNTIGEKLNTLYGANHFTWGTYGDAESPYFCDAKSFINTFDLRVRSWSQKEVPKTPDEPGKPGCSDKPDADDPDTPDCPDKPDPDDPDTPDCPDKPDPEDPDNPDDPGCDRDEQRHEECEGKQWKLGVGVYKTDKETGEALAYAKFGLYTADDIYNVDGKLLVSAGTLFAAATTDRNGFANFGVDLALLSKGMDGAVRDDTLLYKKTVTFSFDEFIFLGNGQYLIRAEGCDDLLLILDPENGSFSTSGGQLAVIDPVSRTVTYVVEESIDGNTAANTGRYYIKELTPPDGYLYDDTEYYVDFQYDDDKTMYIPVYAEHANLPVEVELNKMDLTGQEEVPGARVSVYKVKDVNQVDADGKISHADENLYLIESWISGEKPHLIKGLLLSNTEWPRLNNEEVRENVYVYREEIPAPGFTRAADIEFQIYQIRGEDGWIDLKTGKPYGYEVLVNALTCNEDYLSGSLISPIEHADGWFRNGEKGENTWDYSKTLDAYTEVHWLLVNQTLVLSILENANAETLEKILKEEDFASYDFDRVYLDFKGKAFSVDFYPEKQMKTRPQDSYLTYTQMWDTLDRLTISMYDDTTKVEVSKTDIVTGKEVIGAHLRILDENGNVVDSWVTKRDENGNVIPHILNGKLEVGHSYVLEETLAPTEDGYVKSNSIRFTVQDDGSIQKAVMQDDFTKLEIGKADITTGAELDGAVLELWAVDQNGKKTKRIERWTTGSDGYDKAGTPIRHRMEYLPVGDYVLVEVVAPEGYMLSEDLYFTVTETGILQSVRMLDASTALTVYKYRTGTKEFVSGATIEIYAVPEQYIDYLKEGMKVAIDGGIENTPDGTPGTAAKGTGLLSYLTKAEGTNTEHRYGYTTILTLSFALPKEALANSLSYTMELPEQILIDAEDIGSSFTVYDGGKKAFTYTLEQRSSGRYGIALTFEEVYAKESEQIAFYVSFLAGISEKAMQGSGNLQVDFGNDIYLTIPASQITEVDSSLNEDVLNIHLSKEDLRATVVTKDQPVRVPGLSPGWYIALEVKAPSGYVLDPTPQVFHLITATGEQALTFYNTKKPGGSGGSSGTPENPPENPPGNPPVKGRLTLKVGNGWWWNNIRTEDNGELGSSILLTIERENVFPYILLAGVLFGMAAGGGILLCLYHKKRKKEGRR